MAISPVSERLIEVLKELMPSEHFKNQADIARAMQTKDRGTTVHLIFKGERNFTIEHVSHILESCSIINPDYIMTGRGEKYRTSEEIKSDHSVTNQEFIIEQMADLRELIALAQGKIDQNEFKLKKLEAENKELKSKLKQAPSN